jgi:hypothetical protein
MIIVQLKGGLGNQLFQYAAGLSLAEHHRVVVKVDPAELNQTDKHIGTFRTFDLQQTLADPLIATENEIQKIRSQHIIAKYIDKLRPAYQRKIYKEADFRFDQHFFEAGDNIYLKGYRQSQKYFLPIEKKIRQCFHLKDEAVANVLKRGQELQSGNSIAIHIRRGDYSKKIVREFHGIPDDSYYQQAINYFEKKYDDCRFYIFSDDPHWVKNNLNFRSAVTLVSGNYSHTPFEDFYLISQCRHQIIANSTFSWWAAWLNPSPGKIVIAPKRWFNNAPYDTRDLIPESWIKM